LLGCTLTDTRSWGIHSDGGESWVLEKAFAADGDDQGGEHGEGDGETPIISRG
jgi:hypothetical protein